MNQSHSLSIPVQCILKHQSNLLLKQVLLVLVGASVLALASQLSIPLQPVPLTFQSVTVLLIGMVCGARYGAAVVLAYLFAGVMGLPVFASGVDFISSSGYLVGFVPAAFVTGYLAEKGLARHVFGALLTACVGAGIIFACGLAVLTMLVGFDTAIQVGLMPFIISEPVKLVAVALFVPVCWIKK